MAKRTLKLDEYNKKILATVHKEADLSNQELAERVGLSPSACFQRKKALQEAGYFFNFHTEMDLDRICQHVLAYVEIYLHSNTEPHKSAFENAIQAIPEFMDCLRISGDIDYISFTCFPDLATLKATCDELSSRPELGIRRLDIRPVLERTKWYLGYPLEKLNWLE
ncbi:Lrp/AsnC family transcriptional regulator [Alteromonas gilva]|uniref:Lrp/AsnC family transcriptional regulator n=1 Tax=Alteromonas gilva TaxID=2987522 RepID=A0ABT5KXY0_9ALTE|nr:Lrp/AsnC family transcriptional regulator [Alteromonas gilva]MDC8829483.1 Lrp/AsnC family transcriptional regulator [Alteromonas gilva]